MFKEKIYIVKYYHSVEDRNANSTSGITVDRFLETKIIKEGKGIDIQIKKLEAMVSGFELVDVREI